MRALRAVPTTPDPAPQARPRRQRRPRYTLAELVRQAECCHSFGASVRKCGELGGLELEKAKAPGGMDAARWSRIGSGREGIRWEQLRAVVDGAGNDLPLVWMLLELGYDPTSLRRLETEYQAEAREARAAEARARRRVRQLEQQLANYVLQAPAANRLAVVG